MRNFLGCTKRTALCLVLAAASAAWASPLVRTVQSFPDGQEPAYIGNGLLGYRVPPNPLAGWKAAASGYVMDFGQEKFETLAYAPYPFITAFRMAGETSTQSSGNKPRTLRQSLDFSCGELTTEMEAPLGGSLAPARVLQFVSRQCPVIACQQIELTVPKAGELVVESRVVWGPHNEIYATTPEGNDRVVDLMLGLTTGRSRCGISVKVDANGVEWTRLPFAPDAPQVARSFRMPVTAGQQVIIRTVAATVSSLYHPEPNLESCRMVNWAGHLGFNRLREDNRQVWAEIFKSRIKVSGDPRAQAYLDGCLYYLFSSAHPSCRTSIPPFGLSQSLNYYGHVFWDTDIYMMPALLLISPETARATVDYRASHLKAARKRAQLFGYPGIMYPWESDSTGAEATPSAVSCGWAEHHSTPCVAAGAWWYQQAAGDAAHARRVTWPILQGVCDWIVGRSSRTSRGYEIRNVISSYEGDAYLNNSAYVNGVSAQALRYGVQCAALVGEQPDPRWSEIADRLVIPAGPAPADSGITGDIIWMHDGGWVSGAPTDMFMLGFPFDMPLGRERLRRTYDYFMSQLGPTEKLNMGTALTIGDGTFLGDRKGSYVLLHRLISEESEPAWGMGLEYSGEKVTCFTTTMGAMLQTAMMGMTGLRFERDRWLKYDACLPENWVRIEVDRIWLANQPYRLLAEHGRKAQLIPAAD
jgi:trehalose/maltose hydrolase-like predicted phosphorylase